MIDTYIDCNEYKRLIEEQKIKPAALKAFLKSNGIFLTSSNSKTLAESMYTIFLGVKDLSEFQELLYGANNYEKSLIFEVTTSDDVEGNILDVVLQGLNTHRTRRINEYSIGRPVKVGDDAIFLEMTYYKKTSGKNKIFEREPRTMRVFVRKDSEHKAIVDIRQQSTYDASRVIDFFEKIKQIDDDGDLFVLRHLNFGILSKENRIKFFDRLIENKFTQWSLKTVTGLTVKKYELDNDINKDENEEEIIEDDNGKLAGISQAILNGQGLRNNEFVQGCLNEGFYISSMRLRYYHLTESTEFIIEISFKGIDLKVDMCRSYVIEDERPIHHPFLKDEQDAIVKEFQDTAKDIYEQITLEQKNSASTTKPVYNCY